LLSVLNDGARRGTLVPCPNSTARRLRAARRGRTTRPLAVVELPLTEVVL
jgi:hypothetical protein